jgi:outer membrane lipoprotein-sorting protein
MRKWTVFAPVAAAVLALGAEAGNPTADELVQKNIEARGGLEKLHAVKSLRMTGTMSLGNEAAAPTVLEFQRPSKVRWQFTVDGQTAVQAYDGKTAWVILPFSGDSEPHEMSAEDRKGIALQADIDGPLVDAEKKGNTITLVGREKPDGRDAWKLKITTSDGDERFVFLDAKTYLQFMTVTERTVEGRKMEIVNRIGDYRDVDGVKLPHSFEAGAEGVPDSQVLHFDKIEVNVPIDDSRFAMPSAKGGK